MSDGFNLSFTSMSHSYFLYPSNLFRCNGISVTSDVCWGETGVQETVGHFGAMSDVPGGSSRHSVADC